MVPGRVLRGGDRLKQSPERCVIGAGNTFNLPAVVKNESGQTIQVDDAVLPRMGGATHPEHERARTVPDSGAQARGDDIFERTREVYRGIEARATEYSTDSVVTFGYESIGGVLTLF